ncbi:integrin beta-PS-like [Neocloeon triangulifer]|uniref:integrin beta-PS-like n=1 Tax=Neocloeon triangulifer TaxID=2078957 RepID=UPI00286F5ECD|nr:integrin beta-PS-like [Neocloeon triangulifer]
MGPKLLILLVSIGTTLTSDPCQVPTIKTCGDCISAAGCVWCTSKPSNGESQCASAGKPQGWCGGSIVDPNALVKVVENKLLNTNPGQIVQVKPQKLKIKTRPGKTAKFQMQYTQAKDYPLDLYYLMDLSQSMKDDKDKLSSLGKELAVRMQAQSSNLQMGFGSFVDKTVMPFVNTIVENKIPCLDCEPAYSFKNHLRLTTQTSQFATSVERTKISGNVDTPEGGFDALMQVMVCAEEIGWRNEALKMIIFSTDAESHYAGDGKLGGIVEPNDEKCHMDASGSYTHALIQDYPSVAQISNNARERKMNIIFAVTQNVNSTYVMMNRGIHGSKTGILAGDSGNIVDLIENEYKQLTQSVVMDYQASSDVTIEMFSNCGFSTAPLKTNKCEVKKKGDSIIFDIKLSVKCPLDKTRRNQKVFISPQSINEKLEIDLEIDCECDCEKQGQFSPNDQANCNSHGDFKCGTCVCQPGFWGSNCNCNSNSSSFDERDKSQCELNGQICSSRGECRCGTCVCDNPLQHFGKHCDCDVKRCKIGSNGRVCSDHGTCGCEGCVCQPGWSGPACGCSENKAECTPPGGDQVCSGNGICECGECKCRFIPGKGKYSGVYCEDCPNCQGKCEELKPCVLSVLQSKEGETLEMHPDCEIYHLYKLQNLTSEAIQDSLVSSQPLKSQKRQRRELRNSLETNFGGESLPDPEAIASSRLCSYPLQGCTYYYRYLTLKDKILRVFINENKECPPPVDILGAVLGLIGAILLAGIVMLIIWKVATTIHDRREFAKFEKEREAAMWDAGNNPLYREPASTFQNPTFSGQ